MNYLDYQVLTMEILYILYLFVYYQFRFFFLIVNINLKNLIRCDIYYWILKRRVSNSLSLCLELIILKKLLMRKILKHFLSIVITKAYEVLSCEYEVRHFYECFVLSA